MRALVMAVAGLNVLAATPTVAQQYPPNVPVCLQTYDIGGGYTECAYASIPQCQAAASGRSAQCIVNPFFNAQNDSRRTSRRGYGGNS